MFSSDIGPRPAPRSSIEQLPTEILRLVSDQSDLEDVISLGQSSQKMFSVLSAPEVLRPRVRGGGAAVDGLAKSEELKTPWQQALADAAIVPGLKHSPYVLPVAASQIRSDLSDSGRFFVHQQPNGDVMAIDLLFPARPQMLLAPRLPPSMALELFDKRELLITRSDQNVQFWQVGATREPTASLRLSDTYDSAAAGDQGRRFVQHDGGSGRVSCYRTANLLLGRAEPSSELHGVEKIAVASHSDRIAVVRPGFVLGLTEAFDVAQNVSRPIGIYDGSEEKFTFKTVELWAPEDHRARQQQLLVWPKSDDLWSYGVNLWISPNGKRVVVAPHTSSLLVLPLTDWTVSQPRQLNGLCGCGIDSLLLSYAGDFLSFEGAESDINLFDLMRSRANPVYDTPSGSCAWLHAFGDDGKFWFNDHDRLDLRHLYQVRSQETLGTATVPENDQDSMPSAAPEDTNQQELAFLPPCHGEKLYGAVADIDEDSVESMTTMNGDAYVSVRNAYLEPQGEWGILQSDRRTVAYATGGTAGYMAAVLRKLAQD